jgi:ABC-type transport system substrate-binding protein/class 3 adenylate cyclase
LTEPRDPSVVETEVPPSTGSPTASRETELRTFLIADIRGYTTYTRERGDEAGAALASQFADLVAEVVKARDGTLIELRGDEALVMFVSARKALRAAIDLQARFTEAKLPRGVGIGLDAGEAIPVGDGYRGTALNLAARLCAEAGPGETLASETVIHLAAKLDGIAYVDARALKLKGYIDLVRVVDVVPSERAKGRRLASGNGWAGRNRTRYAIAGVVAVVVVALVGGVLGLGLFSLGGTAIGPLPSRPRPSPSGGPSSSPSNSPTGSPDPLAFDKLPLLAFYDGSTGQLRATTPFPSQRNIAFYSAGSFWMLSSSPRAFNRIDPETHEVVQFLNIPLDEYSGFNYDDNSIWVTDLGGPHVVRLDKVTGVKADFYFGKDDTDQASAHDIAVGDGSVWLSRPDADPPEVTRIDAETGDVQARIEVEAFGLTYGEGSLWFWRRQELGRVDPDTNKVAFTPVRLGTVDWLGNIYTGGGYAWTADSAAGTVHRVDSTGHSISIALAPGVGEMGATKDKMWVTNATTGQLVGLDLVTGQQRQVIDTGHATLAVAAGGDQLMVAVSPTVDEAISQLDGEVLTIVEPGQPWWDPSPDPALNGDWEIRQALNLTCVSLVTYPDKPGLEGFELVHEAADGMPTISPDGRTYTFKIKPGFMFSPPSNEPVTAETFRYSIERTMSRVLGGDNWPGLNMFGGIAGVAEYRAGTDAHISGLVADGDRLIITLAEPEPDFLHRLALPFACPVPARTPILRSGLNPDPPVSGAGPYYVASKIHRRLVILKKNPNYHGSRPQPWDAIAFRLDTAPAIAVDQVQRGVVDAMQVPGWDPIGGATSTLAAEWGPTSEHAAAGDQRWFGAYKHGVRYIALNPSRPAFSDPDVRRAVSLALDRVAISSIWVEGPSTELLSPAVLAASSPTDPVPAPDLDAARALIGDRQLTVTLKGRPEEDGCSDCMAFETAVVGQLQKIGITVEVNREPLDFDDWFLPENGIDMVDLGTWTEFADPVSAIGDLHADQWLDEATLAELDRVDSLTGQERIDGVVAFANKLVNDDVLVIPISHPVFPFFISERLGCGFVQPALGAVDLLSLCVKDGGAATPSPSASP